MKYWIFSLLLIAPQLSYAENSKETMQKLYQVLKTILTDITQDARYFDEANKNSIEKHIGQFVAVTHNLNPKHPNGNHNDPTFPILSQSLISEAELAYSSFHMGQTSYARGILRTVTGTCIECHSRSTSEADLKDFPFDPELKDFTALEKARFFIASKQTDRALEQYEEVLKTLSPSKSNLWDWEAALREGLTIAVRVKNDSRLAETIIDSVLKETTTPQYIKIDARIWKSSISEWNQEKKKKLKSSESIYQEALRLMSRAQKIKKYPMDHSADLIFLRASKTLYDYIKTAPSGPHIADVFLLQGLCYETLNPKHFENLHDLYYEACIRTSPHTNLAQNCYARLEQSIYFGFTGSSGTHLPEDVSKKLLDLWGLSFISKGLSPQ
jgi:tetratricopeptide (TPR) repeat protein